VSLSARGSGSGVGVVEIVVVSAVFGSVGAIAWASCTAWRMQVAEEQGLDQGDSLCARVLRASGVVGLCTSCCEQSAVGRALGFTQSSRVAPLSPADSADGTSGGPAVCEAPIACIVD
jgi:hypothetical protein